MPDRDGNDIRYDRGDTVDLTVLSKRTVNAMVRAGCIDKPDEGDE